MAGATVRLEAASPDKDCSKLTPLEPPSIKRPNVANTQADGAYSVWVAFPFVGGKTLLLLCVTHPDYEDFQYSTIYEDSFEETNGQSPLLIRLKRAEPIANEARPRRTRLNAFDLPDWSDGYATIDAEGIITYTFVIDDPTLDGWGQVVYPRGHKLYDEFLRFVGGLSPTQDAKPVPKGWRDKPESTQPKGRGGASE